MTAALLFFQPEKNFTDEEEEEEEEEEEGRQREREADGLGEEDGEEWAKEEGREGGVRRRVAKAMQVREVNPKP